MLKIIPEGFVSIINTENDPFVRTYFDKIMSKLI